MQVARGFTLTELMLAMTISSAFFVSATGVALGHLKRQTVLQHKLALMEETSLLQQAISSELRRAGFVSLPLTDYFFAPDDARAFGVVKIGAYKNEISQSCITFSYDKNKNGIMDVTSPAEQVGFRLKEKTIEYRMAGRDCSQSGWQDLSTPGKITVTGFSVKGPYPASLGVFFDITLGTRSVAKPSLTRKTQFRVDVPNVPHG